MEQIQSHEIRDVYRIREGLLVEVHKYKSLGHYNYKKKKEKRVRGCKGLTILTEEYTDTWNNTTYPVGTYFLGSLPVEPINDPYQFKIEIKSSGGSILGDFVEMEKVLYTIKEIMNKYSTML